MLKNILDLEGVNVLSKKEQNSVFGGGCTCGFPNGTKVTYSGIDYPELLKSSAHCWSFCDARRAEKIKKIED